MIYMPSYLWVCCILSQPLPTSLEQAASWTAMGTATDFSFMQLNEEDVVVPVLEAQ